MTETILDIVILISQPSACFLQEQQHICSMTILCSRHKGQFRNRELGTDSHVIKTRIRQMSCIFWRCQVTLQYQIRRKPVLLACYLLITKKNISTDEVGHPFFTFFLFSIFVNLLPQVFCSLFSPKKKNVGNVVCVAFQAENAKT